MEQILQSICDKIQISRVADITGLDTIGLPVVLAIRPASKTLSIFQGKAKSFDQAKTAAIMEALEAYCLENPPIKKLSGAYLNLFQKGMPVVSPNLFRSKLIDDALELENEMLEWVEAYNIHSGELHYLPRSIATLDFSANDPRFVQGTNGMGAAFSEGVAIEHGAFEAIERYSLAQWQLSQNKDDTLVCNDSLPDIDILHTLCENGIYYKIWCIYEALPTFHCVIWDGKNILNQRAYTGTATRKDKESALCAAIYEAIQSRTSLITGARDDIFPEYYATRSVSPPKMQVGKLLFKDISRNVAGYLSLLPKDTFIIKHDAGLQGVFVRQVVSPGLNTYQFRM